MLNKRKRFLSACSVLSGDIQSVFVNAPDVIVDTAAEIILRADRPLCVECPQKRFYFTRSGCVTDSILDKNMVVVSKRSLFDTFQNICNYSIYSRQNEINNGYITLRGGHRAGICGTAVLSDEKIVNIKDITTINIRIARQLKGCSDVLYSMVDPLKGVLICGAPCSGKTTIIRDLARRLSYEYKVSVIDERNELSSNVNGEFQNDMGMCDVFDSYIKDDAINHAIRVMSPQIIVCDEISTLSDFSTVYSCVNNGVAFVATVHADSIDSIKKKEKLRELLNTGAFTQLVFLDSRQNAGVIKNVINIQNIGGDVSA